MEKIKHISKINGLVIQAKGTGDFSMHDMVYVGKEKLIGEVISCELDIATIQVYESTTGLTIGEIVETSQEPLCVELGPGLIGNVLDGIGRPLNVLKAVSGNFITRGIEVPLLDEEKTYHFKPIATVGDKTYKNMLIGEVSESESIVNKIMNYFDEEGILEYVAPEGEYRITDTIARYKNYNITMSHKWSVRKPRTYKNRLKLDMPLITGQRVIDTLFPIAKGGTAAIPGSFGTGKTMTQHQFAKWCDADIIVYIGCGERGNEMTEVLEDFPKLMDPRTNRPLMERTVLIANTSNMPVAAREASIYTGVTIAEYYRDMGYNVAIMADSTSRWAEALREISARLEEMPAEEGFPAYLPSRLSEFYSRAGKVTSLNNEVGSISIIGAVSPQGSDFSEPVTSNTKRFIKCFWGLDRELAYARHYPAISWVSSYSEYFSELDDWYVKNVCEDFVEKRKEITKLLSEESSLMEIAKLVGQDVLPDSQKLILETCRAIRLGFLQQNAFHKEDSFTPLMKQYKIMESIMLLYNEAKALIQMGIPLSEVKKLDVFEDLINIKYTIKNSELHKFEDLNKNVEAKLQELKERYVD
ncbi:MAG: V-type ATP synthase subunit A [Oscillospiraceae bacterium]|nr:V-type ATP synthase subunit A [Oscillospiraceae bacterium]